MGWPVWGGKELRGIYCVLPKERTSSSPSLADAARAGAHIDPEPVHLVASGYIDKVPQGGGGIALFPGSHRLLYEAEPDSVDLARYSILHPPHPDQRRRRLRAAPSLQASRRHWPTLNPLSSLATPAM